MDGKVPVLVTTAHRGVFFGWADPETVDQKSIRLAKVKNCISWASSVRGVFGLAATGPNHDCRIGAEAPSLLLHDVTSVAEVSEQAVAAWNAS
jgi:hypothetical protein